MIGEVLTFLCIAGLLGWIQQRFNRYPDGSPKYRSFRLYRKPPDYAKIRKEIEEKQKRADERFFRILTKRAVENLQKEMDRQTHGIIWHTDFITGEVTWKKDPRFYPEDSED
jgi:hypothetical protein